MSKISLNHIAIGTRTSGSYTQSLSEWLANESPESVAQYEQWAATAEPGDQFKFRGGVYAERVE